MAVAKDARQSVLGSGTAAALKVPEFCAVKLATDPSVIPSGVELMPENPIAMPVTVPNVAIDDDKVRSGAETVSDAEFVVPKKTALVNVAVRKSGLLALAGPGLTVNSMVPEKS